MEGGDPVFHDFDSVIIRLFETSLFGGYENYEFLKARQYFS